MFIGKGLDNIKDLKEWRKTSLNTLRVFDQNQGIHAILVDKAMLERDPAFEKSLLNKAKKQQDPNCCNKF
jgi:hypothetical protein